MADQDEVIDRLNDLVSINIDSHRGWAEAAENTNDPALQQFFTQMAEVRERNADELRELVRELGSDPTDAGSVSATMHRWWIDAKQALTGDDAFSVLNEAERGEDAIKDEYEEALTGLEGSGAEPIVRKQYENVRRGHDEVKALRERYRNPRG